MLSATSAGAALLAAAVCLAACASGGAGGAPPDPEQRFYEGRCGVCHAAYHPADARFRSHWEEVVQTMGPRAGLSQAQRARIVRWLNAAAAAAGNAGAR